MIEFIEGELVQKSPTVAIVSNGGLGFGVQIPLSTFDALPREGQSIRLLTHLYVREDEMRLYGFASATERQLFRMLLNVSRIGPMVALRVLSSCQAAQFKQLVLSEDGAALAHMVKGIGTKTARRLILELQDPIKELDVEFVETPAAQLARDTVQALVALGESRQDAERAVRAAMEKLGGDVDQQQLMREALSR
jgi:Holliday junction DNA helicase RuvA